ncbi:helix-turn-helix domain-containing protein [Streptomyces sp. NBC_00237]|uniref:helix-turn-helix domain-containing protein n=1 Tax=Streptomyces sp. NBC_00237 TaxID=2975687 RepID=UPI002257AE64|nr:helix-turn-helix domain-containing protein [Streptomyces sp. NBC_00237]MCX5204251.1 helix-turn-helix domain-containing protein [Streptomyces sp. NBC_00237]
MHTAPRGAPWRTLVPLLATEAAEATKSAVAAEAAGAIGGTMLYQEFGTSSLPPEYRFVCVCAEVGRGAGPGSGPGGCTEVFAGRARLMTLGPVRLTAMALPAPGAGGCAKLLRSRNPAAFELNLVLDGTTKTPRDEVVGEPRAFTLHLPQDLVPLPRERIRELFARGLPPADSGMSRVLAHYVQTVAEEAPSLDARTAARLGATALDLAGGFFAEQLSVRERLPPGARQQVLLAAVTAFIEDNLAAPHLAPETVAARHRVSVRQLHQLFRHQPETVAARIRRRRLERCQQDLAAPHLSALPVYAVGARWGLTNATGFSRAFRAAYGMTPGEYRRLALRIHGPGTAPEGP